MIFISAMVGCEASAVPVPVPTMLNDVTVLRALAYGMDRRR
jgi:hypothetical protein